MLDILLLLLFADFILWLIGVRPMSKIENDPKASDSKRQFAHGFCRQNLTYWILKLAKLKKNEKLD